MSLNKIYYKPALISAILVPVIFLYLALPYLKKLENQTVIDIKVGWAEPAGRFKNKNIARDFIPITGHTYQYFNAHTYDKSTITKAKKAIEQLIKNNVHRSGIKFNLTKENTYADLVAILDLMLPSSNANFYGFDGQAVYLIHEDLAQLKPEREYANWCGGSYTYEAPPTLYQNIILNQPILYLAFGFLLLLYAALLRPRLNFRFQI